jgi:hypothetical protein
MFLAASATADLQAHVDVAVDANEGTYLVEISYVCFATISIGGIPHIASTEGPAGRGGGKNVLLRDVEHPPSRGAPRPQAVSAA